MAIKLGIPLISTAKNANAGNAATGAVIISAAKTPERPPENLLQKLKIQPLMLEPAKFPF